MTRKPYDITLGPLDRADAVKCPEGRRHRAHALFVRADIPADVKARQGTRPRVAIVQDTCARCRVAIIRAEPLIGKGGARATAFGRVVFRAISSGRLRYSPPARSYGVPEPRRKRVATPARSR